MRYSFRVRLRRLVLFFACCTAYALTPPAAADLADCDKRFAASPESESATECFFNLTFPEGPDRATAARRIVDLQQRYPANGWLSLYLGHMRVQEVEQAIVLYRSAARAFAARREARGEILARSSLYRLLVRQERLNEAGQEAQRAAVVAEASGNPQLLAMGQILQARYLSAAYEDLERAYLLLRRAEEVLFPGGRYFLQRDCLLALANVGFQTGRIAEARDSYRRIADLAKNKGDYFAEATARYNLASSLLEAMAEMPRPGGTQEIVRQARQALAAAEKSSNREIRAKSQWMLGFLTEREEAFRYLEACLGTAAPQDQGYCLNALTRQLTAVDPQEARRTADRALALAHQSKDPWDMALAWRERMRVSWAAASQERAVADSKSALDAIEALRDLQTASTSQAGMFSAWTDDYYWLSGRLLEEGLDGHLEDAFVVTERMRARSLIDALEAARATSAKALPLRQQRATVLERISAVQRRLLDPDLPAAGRGTANQELERLEIEEADLRDRLTRADPSFTALRRREFATLAHVRQVLLPDQALLSFQIAPWKDARGEFAGGSWLLVSTQTSSRVYRLPDRLDLRPAVRLFTGMFERRDGSEVHPSVRLYQQLLAPALADLPEGVQRLVLIPDDALHQLPFGALREKPEAPPLASRFELSVVPSATLWLEWKEQRPTPAETPALALADPPPPGSRPVVMAASERAAVFADAVQLGALPYARQESRAVVRALGGGSVRRLGDDASEEFVKQTRLSRFGLLHFATHAVLDAQNPERSGVLLAPAGEEDGLLQIREIVDLDIDGRIVVLASCRSASGTLLRGEGVMGLARAFFQAGSHAVVASLWPLRDDDAAALFDRFYQHLGRGASLAEALRAAQRDRIAAGAPAAAWAGLVVLGDGDLVPVPGGRKDPAFGARELVIGLIAVALGLVWAWLWRARTREQRQKFEQHAPLPGEKEAGSGRAEKQPTGEGKT